MINALLSLNFILKNPSFHHVYIVVRDHNSHSRKALHLLYKFPGCCDAVDHCFVPTSWTHRDTRNQKQCPLSKQETQQRLPTAVSWPPTLSPVSSTLSYVHVRQRQRRGGGGGKRAIVTHVACKLLKRV